ncbi:hypothetical protein WICPIJ_000604 [Wickerhamomyces pijperi]|uniref:Uncharacterized protein n=1 Tax=Wickerhamomyces pijperi TaxID=599730 RepID=A0A9P8QGB3_WICPI|nr:hypothetical protein WICPIJ_000604 [Wickerhamomyces pijperi]
MVFVENIDIVSAVVDYLGYIAVAVAAAVVVVVVVVVVVCNIVFGLDLDLESDPDYIDYTAVEVEVVVVELGGFDLFGIEDSLEKSFVEFDIVAAGIADYEKSVTDSYLRTLFVAVAVVDYLMMADDRCCCLSLGKEIAAGTVGCTAAAVDV